MRMPTTTNTKVKNEPKAPKSIDLNTDDSDQGEFEDAGKQCITFLEKKMRNLEKRKKKMDLNKQKALNGEKLEKEALLSLEQYDAVAQDLQFARELHKQFFCINEQHEDSMKKTAKKEIKRIEEILKLQFTLDQLGGDNVRQDFITGKHGAVVLSQDNLDQLDALYQVISPTRESQEKDDVYTKKLCTASEHLVNFLDGEESQVVGTTYKELRELVTLINGCGYFERVQIVETQDKSRDQETEVAEEVTEVELTSMEESEPVIEQTSEDSVEPTDSIAQSIEEAQSQPLNTLEQDAFFAPSSSPYQPSSDSTTTPFSSQSAGSNSNDISDSDNKSSQPDIQSFTHNRPFQFIQTSYVMPDTDSPSVVDPAVIAAQPAGAHGLQFMSPIYDTGVVTSTSIVQQSQHHHQQQQQPSQQQTQPPQQHQSASGLAGLSSQQQSQTTPSTVTVLGMPVDLSQGPVDLSQSSSSVKQQQNVQPAAPAQDYNVQSSFPQSDSLFPTPSVSRHDDVNTTSLPTAGHSDTSRGTATTSMRDDTISSINSFEIPPSIPMPPSQSQETGQVEPQEKKSPMNANAPVFQSMYAQQQGVPPQVNMPPPQSVNTSVSDIQVPQTQSDYTPNTFGGPSGDFVGAGDFQSGYQGSNGFANGNYGRGPGNNRSGFRGPRGGGGSGPGNSMNNRNGGGSYQNYGGPGYRSDNFQTTGYGSSSFGNTNSYAKRGGMNSSMGGPGNTGYPPRPAGMGGNTNRGAMRGSMPRGGPRGGPHRGGFSRPQQ